MRSHVRAVLARVRELFRRRTNYAAEQNEEFYFHLEMETAENIRRGMSDGEARRAALLRFGGTQRFREETNDARGVVALDNWPATRASPSAVCSRAPAFAVGVIATLGIGIGAAVGIGTIVYGVLLRDLPYDKPDQLVRVGFIIDGIGTSGDLHSPATYFHFAKSARSFTELGAYWTSDDFNVTDGDAPERVTVALMTPNTFTLLGARPLLGRLFEPGDTSWYGERMFPILISENFWRRRYGADPSIIGRRIDNKWGARAVIGVLPRSFDFPKASVDIFYPAPVPVKTAQITARGFNVIGRLRQGVSPSAAEAELNALIPTLSERFPAITPDMLQRSRARVSVVPLKAATVASVRPATRLARYPGRSRASHCDDERGQPLPAPHRAFEPGDRHRAFARRNSRRACAAVRDGRNGARIRVGDCRASHRRARVVDEIRLYRARDPTPSRGDVHLEDRRARVRRARR